MGDGVDLSREVGDLAGVGRIVGIEVLRATDDLVDLRVALGLDLRDALDVAVALAVSVQEGEADDADEHEGGAEHREDEELQGRVDPLGVAPPADEEVHRHQDQLEHDEEHEQVERAEDTDACALEQEQPGVVRLLVVVGGHRDHREGEQQAGHDDQEQRDAVDPDVPRDPEVGDPVALDLELVAGLAGLEGGQQPDGDGTGADREQQRYQAVELGKGTGDASHGEGGCWAWGGGTAINGRGNSKPDKTTRNSEMPSIPTCQEIPKSAIQLRSTSNW